MEPSATHFPVWSILSDAGNQFRWVSFGSSSVPAPPTPPSISPPLPSISHLLLESQIEDGGRGGAPAYSPTGSGKPVAVKPDSVRKAMLVVGEENDNAKIPKQSLGMPPMFQTGSGKPVPLKQASIQRAMAILGEEDVVEDDTNVLEKNIGEFPMFKTGSGKLVPLKQSSIERAMAVLGEGDIRKKDNTNILEQSHGELPTFKTGSGKLMPLKQSSIKRARAVIGEGDLLEKEQKSGDFPVFKTGLGMLVPLKQSSIQRAMAVLGEGDFQEEGYYTGNFSSLFSTGLEKSLDTYSYDTSRAKALLNLDEASNSSASVEGLPAFVQFHSIKSYDGNGCIMDKSGQHAEDKERIMGGKMNDSNRYLPPEQQNVRSLPKFVNSHDFKPGTRKPPLWFQTAGGQSVSISKGALKRAKSLLGELDLDPNNNSTVKDTSSNKENELCDLCPPNSFQSDIFMEGTLHQGPHPLSAQRKSVTCQGFSMGKDDSLRGPEACSTSRNTHPSLLKTPRHGRQLICPLAEIPMNGGATDKNLSDVDYRRSVSGKKRATPPFKKPRHSRFAAPLSNFLVPSGSSMMSKAEITCRPVVLNRHPPITKRKSIKEYFGRPPELHSQIQRISEDVKYMNADRAGTFVFQNLSGQIGIGIDAFQNMLEQSGASLQKATREWIINHYKWIVWKLASLERSYPAQTMSRYLTVDNVLEELKYRYDREVNYGHRSALKKVLEGDASSASMMVLCISAVRSYTNTSLDQQNVYKNGEKLNQQIQNNSKFTPKIELTDGWYCIHACLDSLLSMQLRRGKLFVGQKLRIWGASLSSWVSPVSPLEASPEINLMLHVNGTYRAHWSEKLGLCRSAGLPLAFRCIKPYGGTIPLTLIGITRIYPVLYKERFVGGGSVVRTERMESRILQLFNQRRCTVVESVISETREENGLPDSCDSDEGAKIFKFLTSTAEPEVLMADMSSEQLNSVAIYQAKKEAAIQSCLLMKIEKALENAGLSAREVTPFVKVRVVGLTSKGSRRKPTKEGLITIWNPSEKQLHNLVEGHAYFVSGLTPFKDETNKLILQARGSTTTWKKLPSSAIDFFEPFFAPRKSTSLLNLGEVALSSEFDVAAVVVYVGEVYKLVSQVMQWVFVTDGFPLGYGAKCKSDSNHVLAIKFCISSADSHLLSPVNSSLTGSLVGFCNLIKRSWDPVNHIWMAEATECSTYSDNLTKFPHLKEAAAAANEWAKLSTEGVNKLKELVLSIVGAGIV